MNGQHGAWIVWFLQKDLVCCWDHAIWWSGVADADTVCNIVLTKPFMIPIDYITSSKEKPFLQKVKKKLR